MTDKMLEPGRCHQVLAIVNHHVRADNRIGGAKKEYMVSAVTCALTRDLDEQTVLNVIAIWRKWCCYPGPYRKDLSALLDETVDAWQTARPDHDNMESP
jgi:hypothetical protein